MSPSPLGATHCCVCDGGMPLGTPDICSRCATAPPGAGGEYCERCFERALRLWGLDEGEQAFVSALAAGIRAAGASCPVCGGRVVRRSSGSGSGRRKVTCSVVCRRKLYRSAKLLSEEEQ